MFKSDFTFVHKYFLGEKQATMIFMIVGCVAIILSVIFYFVVKSNPSFFKGAAIPLFIIGLLIAIAGFVVYQRTDTQRLDVSYNMGLSLKGYTANRELPRMKNVMRNFVVYRYIQIACILIGIGLFIYFRNNTQQVFWKGFGLTLAIMALVTFVGDYNASVRGTHYTKQLEEITLKN
ncbi:MAG: hypothetical protein H7Y31_13575 [Chitinophagaceae bacterium]|nr:hypothetical protein [Chitinophagaceae bacterium]